MQQSAVKHKLNDSHENTPHHIMLGISTCHANDIVKKSQDTDLGNTVD